MATKKVLKFPKAVYLNWDGGKDGPGGELIIFQSLEEFTNGMSAEDIGGEYVAVYELKSVNILEYKTVLAPVK